MTLGGYLATAQELAHRAGAELLRHREAPIVSESKGVPRELVTAADRASERIVVGGLQLLSTRGTQYLFHRAAKVQPYWFPHRANRNRSKLVETGMPAMRSA